MRHKRKTFPLKLQRRFNLFRFSSILLLLLLFAIVSQRQIFPPPKGTKGALKVIKVIDGDTVVLSDGRTLRYIGIDAPERGQPFYEAAKNFNRRLVQGRVVELEFDIERYDRYGRLLAYVFIRDAKGKRIFVNAELVSNGFAKVYTKPPNVRYADLLFRLQEEAREKRKGLWSVYKLSRSPVIANLRTKVFHRPTCPAVRQISPQNRLRLPNAEIALERGFSPCRECQP
ncbi:thermonuclease family protein [Fervidibacter sacchari]|jgi:Micrococcal nuclease (thermonuclease) homologs|uniref:Micrococcal nuclease n=1 Tax=Candidatus Fervidibacter sacchari TaxID=1448929 RepID=A0ABT2EMC4_9BACT|nr:thermonuclease family protein [Candidatus Fervidibacter sacchari]MCS3919096.1 micrococcal nuclease [Candidatus Fervidibacter sacchari]WKU17172.1 thermonuclease family protein [Candidatus Fervidibacter sacchari]